MRQIKILYTLNEPVLLQKYRAVTWCGIRSIRNTAILAKRKKKQLSCRSKYRNTNSGINTICFSIFQNIEITESGPLFFKEIFVIVTKMGPKMSVVRSFIDQKVLIRSQNDSLV